MDRPKKNILKKYFSEKKVEKKETFFFTIYQLKNTSDCIKIDPPGPGRNLKKSQKKSKKVTQNFVYFLTKITFLVILPIKSLWDLSKTTDLVERIRMQFFLSKIDRRTLEL